MPPSNSHSPTDQQHQRQEHLGQFAKEPSTPSTPTQFDEPPIPPNQDEVELLTPISVLDELRDPDSDVRHWLSYMANQYTPPEQTDILLLAPCASEKPMAESKTYRAISKTLSQFPESQQRRIHLVTISEPYGPIPWELQDGETFLYDCPGLFEWWVKENDHQWNRQAQQQSLTILGEYIGSLLDRAAENNWYDSHITCIRHVTGSGGQSEDQTHRQMLETAETIADIELTWLPTEETVTTLADEVSPMAWNMQGVAHQSVQTELAEYLRKALESSTGTNADNPE